MIQDALRYPLAQPAGRLAVLATTAELLAIAVALRYAAALYPVSLLLVPAAIAVVAACGLGGTLAGVAREPASPLGRARRVVADGAVAVALSALALALPVAMLLGSIRSVGSLDPGELAGASLFALLGSTSALILFFAVTYALPAVVAGALSGGVREGFERARLQRTLGSVTYFLAWTVGLPLLVVGWGFLTLALSAAELGGLLAALLAAYCLVAGAHVLGAGYREAV